MEVLLKYDIAIEKQHSRHADNENVTRTGRPQFISSLGIEMHAVKLYTRTIFFDFQKELKKAMWCCSIDHVDHVEDSNVYFVSHQSKNNVAKVIYKVICVLIDLLKMSWIVSVGYVCLFFSLVGGLLCCG